MKDRLTQKAFEFFYRKKYSTSNYLFFFTKSSTSIFEKFQKEIGSEISVEFLYRYLAFQFLYWEGLNLTQVNTISFSHIFGLKAVTRFKERDQDYDWQLFNTDLSKKLKIDKADYYKYLNYSPYQTKFNQNYNDPIRRKYHNTDRGYSTCIDLTTLYNDKDVSCQSCNFNIECKEMLKLNYPKLYKSRYGRS